MGHGRGQRRLSGLVGCGVAWWGLVMVKSEWWGLVRVDGAWWSMADVKGNCRVLVGLGGD